MRRKEKAGNKSLFIWSFSSLGCDLNHSSEKKKYLTGPGSLYWTSRKIQRRIDNGFHI